jgi:alkylation response protein AidB-like acyl-CoA dehydrogenase
MNSVPAIDAESRRARTATEIANELGPLFARRAREAADEDTFVVDNFALIKSSGLLEAGVPTELGGGGASIDDLAAMLRTLAYHCPSTALAFSMHTHQVAIPAWRWMNQKAAAVEPLLKRIAAERIFLLSSGGSDWIAGSGKAEKLDGGYKITARKIFSSGAPAGDLLMTGAILEEEGKPPMVLHFAVPMNSPNVKVLDTWRTLGMRSTGSHDIMIDGHVVPEAAVSLSRKGGEWHPLFQIIATIAFPLVYSVYLGVAEGARDIAIDLARKQNKHNHHALELAGMMETELAGARLACEFMLDAVRKSAPNADTVNQVMTGKKLLTQHAIAAVEHAMALAGGPGFYRAAGLERRFRDIQAARYHVLQSGPQSQYAGAIALGLPTDRIF